MINLFPIIRPFIHRIDPETAHDMTIRALKMGVTGCFGSSADDPILATSVFGLNFSNPVGLAAGFDKNADAILGCQKMGFGFTEAGTVTPKPQAGNPKPRLFRLKEDKAVINRFGFNNQGLEYFETQLRALPRTMKPIGANVGANKDAIDRTADYVDGVNKLYGLSDYFTVNISSPNTPGLRALQSREALEELIGRILEARKAKIQSGLPHIPILVKIAPDLLDEDISDIASITSSTDIDGLIVSNTTIARPDTLCSRHKAETGGLSGAPLLGPSTKILSDVYKATDGKVPLIGVGGISSGKDAFAKIKAGASLVQVYSMLVYEGPALVNHIKSDLANELRQANFSSVADAVGADHR